MLTLTHPFDALVDTVTHLAGLSPDEIAAHLLTQGCAGTCSPGEDALARYLVREHNLDQALVGIAAVLATFGGKTKAVPLPFNVSVFLHRLDEGHYPLLMDNC